MDTTVRFAKSQDQVLAYERALILPRTSDSVEVPPNPPETIPRKAWLIPSELFGDNNPDEPQTLYDNKLPEEPRPVTGVIGCNPISVTRSNDEISSVFGTQNSECNCVTSKNELKEKESVAESSEVPNREIEATLQNFSYTSYTVTVEPEASPNQAVEAVTEKPENPVTRAEIVVTAAPRNQQIDRTNEGECEVTSTVEPALLLTPENKKQLLEVEAELTAGILWKEGEISDHEMVKQLTSLKQKAGDRLYRIACDRLNEKLYLL